MSLRSKIALIAISVSMVFSSLAMAQGQGGPGGPGGRPGMGGPGGPGGRPGGPRRDFDGEILKTLNLTSKQKSTIKMMKDKQRVKMDAIRASSKGDRNAMRAQMKPLRDKYEASLKHVLSPGQFKKYMDARKKMMANMRRGPGGPGGRMGGPQGH